MKYWILAAILLLTVRLFTQTAIPPAAGDGSEDSPYQIANLENLYWIAADNDVVPDPDRNTRWSSHYIQTADIDASETLNWDDGKGWRPIGYFCTFSFFYTPFTGSYNGQGHIIDALNINEQNIHGTVALFGFTLQAAIENLGITNIAVTPFWQNHYVGSLVGYNSLSIIRNCYSTGNVGGIIWVGGLVGVNDHSTIENSYSTVNVDGPPTRTGGLIGEQYSGTVINSYWDIETSGQENSDGGEGRTTEEMTYPYSGNTYVGWDFQEIWVADEDHSINEGYPYLIDPPVSVEDIELVTPQDRITLSNYPNPFNPETTIDFTLPADTERLNLQIYNIRGQFVRRLIPSAPFPAGEHQIVWDGLDERGRPAGSGIFFYRMSTPDDTKTRKMLLLK